MPLQNPFEVDLATLEDLAQEAGHLALSYFGNVDAHWKADHTLVSEADRAIEKFLAKRLIKAYPGSSVLGEEFGLHQSMSDHLWILDPIDGTAAFLRHLPIWSISIGYLFQGKPTAGAVYMPVTQDLFIANEQVAYWNETELAPLTKKPFNSESLLLVTSDTHRSYRVDFVGKTRSFGSAAVEICYVAAGNADAALLGQVSLWDIAGALPVLRAAEAEIYTLDGNLLNVQQMLTHRQAAQPLLATSPAYLRDFVQSISIV